MTIYHFYLDPGHGWLKVRRSELGKLGIADKISGFSYQRGMWVYLEEDSDMTLFLNAKKGKTIKIVDHDSSKSSKIRSYERYKW